MEVSNANDFADVLDDLPASALPLVFGDDGSPTDLHGNAIIGANSIGGLIVQGNIGAANNTVEIDVVTSMGHIIALNGSVHGSVHAGTAIGSIVASEDITGDYISEGTLGLDGFLGTSVVGVPDWFTGGVLAEVGSIDADFA